MQTISVNAQFVLCYETWKDAWWPRLLQHIRLKRIIPSFSADRLYSYLETLLEVCNLICCLVLVKKLYFVFTTTFFSVVEHICESTSLSAKSWPHKKQEFDPPRRLFPWARNLALSSWANAATARGGTKIATALCAITCCFTLLYRVRMPAPHHASYVVIHVLWLYAPFRNKQSMQTRRGTSIRR